MAGGPFTEMGKLGRGEEGQGGGGILNLAGI